ncbi:MAG TPA: hypothetical protein PK230_00430 [Chitinophagales bacterium]|nr:hypothetical protein [Chitinophagales bacterium]
MLHYNENTLKKVEALYKSLGYQVRNGKGTFNTGCCLLEKKKVIVVNSFHSVEAKILALVDLLPEMQPDTNLLNEEQRKLLEQLQPKQ